jgi:LacI family transcriptional regulator
VTTIVDVAQAAGVSISTVSRVLNNSEHPVSEEARQRVLEAVAALHYSPSALARAMITQDTRIIGVIVGDNEDPFFASIVRGAEDVARGLGFLVIVCNSDRQPDMIVQYVKTLNEYRVDGIIFAGGGLTDPEYNEEMARLLAALRGRKCAVVSLGQQVYPGVVVSCDEALAVKDATRYLIHLGHRRICYISGSNNITTSELRLSGYRQALEENGISFDARLVFAGDYSLESGQAAAEQILRMEPMPSAVLASTDQMAIGCLVALKAAGLAIPKEISVMGVNDITHAHCLDPPLTTVSLNMYAMGACGIEYLVKLRNGEIGDDFCYTIQHEIIVRQSTAPPRDHSGSVAPATADLAKALARDA